MKTNLRRGATLAEVLVAMGLSTLVLGAVMSMFLFFVRSSLRITSYADMESRSTRGLELFGRDLRMAVGLSTSGTPIHTVKLSVPAASGSATTAVSYVYNSAQHTLSRTVGSASTVLIRDIQASSFAVQRFDKLQNLSNSDYDVSQLQVSMTIAPDSKGLTAATSKRIVSSRFVLRNL